MCRFRRWRASLTLFTLVLLGYTSLSWAVPTQFGSGHSAIRIVWLPSTAYADATLSHPFAKELSSQGWDVWLSQKDSFAHDLQYALTTATETADHKVYVLAFGDAAPLALQTIHQHQQATQQPLNALTGVILAYPEWPTGTLAQGFPSPPRTYIYQPEFSQHTDELAELLGVLEQHGPEVFVQHLKDVNDGYLENPQRSEDEIMQAAIFPAELEQALKLLANNADTASIDNSQLNKQLMPLGAAGAKAQPMLSAELDSELLKPIHQVAPALRLEDLDRRWHDLNDYRGKVVVLNFWATWCPPCVKEIPALNRLQQRFDQRDLVVLSVDMGEDPDEIADFLDKTPAHYPILLDPDGTTASTWPLKGFPTTIIIDQDGNMRFIYAGDLEWDAEDVIQRLEQAFSIQARPKT